MYLSRLSLEPRSAQARRDLSDPYEMHRTLARAFAVDEQRKPPRFLWRLEAGLNAWASPTVLVQSAATAAWPVIAALPGYLSRAVEIRELQLKTLIAEGTRYRFRLLANPTVSRDGKRYGLPGENEQLQWLGRQGERHGFAVEAALVTASDFVTSRKSDATISVQRACFEGVLLARQPELLMQALHDGIGPAKAFGCGLLSLARC